MAKKLLSVIILFLILSSQTSTIFLKDSSPKFFKSEDLAKLLAGKTNLINAQLAEAKVKDFTIKGDVDLSGSILTKVKFSNVIASGKFNKANFFQAYLTDCDFSKADMSETNLIEATILRCKFNNSKLTKADLSGAVIIESEFKGANLRDLTATYNPLTIDPSTKPEPGKPTIIMSSNFSNAILANADMCNVIIVKSVMENLQNPDQIIKRGITTNFAGQWTSIVGTSFKGSNLDQSSFELATLSNVDLTDTSVTSTNFANSIGLTSVQKKYLIDKGAKYTPN